MNKDLEMIKAYFRSHWACNYNEIGLFEFGICGTEEKPVKYPGYDFYYNKLICCQFDCIVINAHQKRIKGYEFKTNRNDFLNEIKTEKWKKYTEHCHTFCFVCPVGLIKKEEVPKKVGLIYVYYIGKDFPTADYIKMPKSFGVIEQEKLNRIFFLLLNRVKHRKDDFF